MEIFPVPNFISLKIGSLGFVPRDELDSVLIFIGVSSRAIYLGESHRVGFLERVDFVLVEPKLVLQVVSQTAK